MNEATKRRVVRLEDATAPQDDAPGELRTFVEERVFSSRAELAAWSKARNQRSVRGPESASALRIVVVRVGEPSVRDLGELVPLPAKSSALAAGLKSSAGVPS